MPVLISRMLLSKTNRKKELMTYENREAYITRVIVTYTFRDACDITSVQSFLLFTKNELLTFVL